MTSRTRQPAPSEQTARSARTLVCCLLALVLPGISDGNLEHRAAAADDFGRRSTPAPETDASLNIVSAEMLLCDFTASEPTRAHWLPQSIIRSVSIHDHPEVEVPEPLLFDLVHPLGVRKGAVEFNTLAIFPWSASNPDPDEDPFGSGPTTFDKRGIEWAPEVEYAIADNLAVEFEFPFESSTLEEYKLGLQWTIGTAFDGHYIHGFQTLVQPTTEWEEWNSTLLYLGGIEFDDTWSALVMLGGRMDLAGPERSETFERLINVSVFAELSDAARVGLETNYASQVDDTEHLILVPQVQYQFTDNFEIQSGFGFGTFTGGHENSFMLRVVLNN